MVFSSFVVVGSRPPPPPKLWKAERGSFFAHESRETEPKLCLFGNYILTTKEELYFSSEDPEKEIVQSRLKK